MGIEEDVLGQIEIVVIVGRDSGGVKCLEGYKHVFCRQRNKPRMHTIVE